MHVRRGVMSCRVVSSPIGEHFLGQHMVHDIKPRDRHLSGGQEVFEAAAVLDVCGDEVGEGASHVEAWRARGTSHVLVLVLVVVVAVVVGHTTASSSIARSCLHCR